MIERLFGLPQPIPVHGTLGALLSAVTVAIPVLQERISPVLDTAARLLVIRCRQGKEVERKQFVLSPLTTDALARSLAELHVDLLLCAALSEALSRALQRESVRVRPHLCGEVESVLQAYCQHQLNRAEFRMPGCLGPHRHGACCPRRKARKSTGNMAAKGQSK